MTATRIGIVGAGWVARVHAKALAGFDDVRIVAVASRHPEPAAELAKPFEARVYDDYRSMLDQAELDGVFVCVPPDLQVQVALAVVDRGLAIMAEKPLGLDETGPERVAKTVKEKGLISCVGYQWRYLDVVDTARELLEANPPSLVIGSWLGETPGADWWVQRSRSGGQIVEQATHIFDLARYLAGELEPVAAWGRRIERPRPAGDIQSVTQTSLRFASGALGTISTTCLLDAAHRVELETISDGMALTLEVLNARLLVRRASGVETLRPPSAFETPYERQDRAFIDAVQGKPNRIRSTYDDALRTHRATLAASRLALAEEAGLVQPG
jgi:predicted dehydrogenase